MTQIKATDYPDVYSELGIDTGRLGCIMAQVDPISISDFVHDDDYFYSETQSYVKGNVSEDVPHVTLLYGLMRSGHELSRHVDAVLAGFTLDDVTIDKVDFFYGLNNEYITIVALVDVTDNLKEAHARLSLLPHIDTFGEYHPHITLAYVKNDSDWKQMISNLGQRYNGTPVKTIGLDYGD